MASEVSSWLGNGANAPVGGNALSAALGPDTIAQLARQFGLSGDQVAAGLSDALPGLVDKLSPQGEVSNDNALLEQGLVITSYSIHYTKLYEGSSMFESAELGHAVDKKAYDEAVPELRAQLLDAQFDLLESASFSVVILVSYNFV